LTRTHVVIQDSKQKTIWSSREIASITALVIQQVNSFFTLLCFSFLFRSFCFCFCFCFLVFPLPIPLFSFVLPKQYQEQFEIQYNHLHYTRLSSPDKETILANLLGISKESGHILEVLCREPGIILYNYYIIVLLLFIKFILLSPWSASSSPSET
jgi:hypothetical protein